MDPGIAALGTWSGGRFMHFGEPLEEDRLAALLRPDADDRHRDHRRRLRRRRRPTACSAARSPACRASEVCVVGAVGHDFYTGERAGAKGFPRFTDPRAARPRRSTRGYLRMATERSLERCGIDHFDVLLLHNPDRVGYTSEVVWEGMAALRDARADARCSASRPDRRTASRST